MKAEDRRKRLSRARAVAREDITDMDARLYSKAWWWAYTYREPRADRFLFTTDECTLVAASLEMDGHPIRARRGP